MHSLEARIILPGRLHEKKRHGSKPGNREGHISSRRTAVGEKTWNLEKEKRTEK